LGLLAAKTLCGMTTISYQILRLFPYLDRKKTAYPHMNP
jgi:hypothetical protein